MNDYYLDIFVQTHHGHASAIWYDRLLASMDAQRVSQNLALSSASICIPLLRTLHRLVTRKRGSHGIPSQNRVDFSFLRGRRTWRCLVDILSSSVGVGRRLHLDFGLSAAEIALILAAIVASGTRAVDGRNLLLVVVRSLLLCLVVGIVGGLAVSPGCPSCPTSAIEWLSTRATSAARAKATAQEEEKEKGHENGAQSHPSSPAIPG